MCLFITHVNSFWFIILEKHIAYCILVLASGFTSPEVHAVFQQKSAGDKFVSVLVCLKKKKFTIFSFVLQFYILSSASKGVFRLGSNLK